jgi:hypothetical protein
MWSLVSKVLFVFLVDLLSERDANANVVGNFLSVSGSSVLYISGMSWTLDFFSEGMRI